MTARVAAFLLLVSCLSWHCSRSQQQHVKQVITGTPEVSYKSIGAIPLPKGFKRVAAPAGSFGAWLRQVALKADKTVYLYNGTLKNNQTAQFAVLDIPVGEKDLQQCADAVMRLYAEYQFANGRYEQIRFNATDGSPMDYASWMQGYRFSEKNNRLMKQLTAAPCKGHECLDNYLQTVFSWAGTYSLSKELLRVPDINDIAPGYVFIKGGSPGHAVIVADVAYNPTTGKKIFLLAQSYMPAQDIHILQNPYPSDAETPWYSADMPGKQLNTPEWVFTGDQLKRFP